MPDSRDNILLTILAKCDQILAASEDMLKYARDDEQRDAGLRAWDATKDMQEIVEASIQQLRQIK
jgi:hypothetical protein